MHSETKVGHNNPQQRSGNGVAGDNLHKVERPGHGCKAAKFLESVKKERNQLMKGANDRKAMKKEAFMSEFWRNFDLVTVRASAYRGVEMGISQASTELDEKRNKLKSILLGEISEMTSEYTKKCQEAFDKRLEAEKRKAEDIMKISDNSDQIRAQDAYLKMAMENNDSYKSKIRMEMSKNIQEANKEMIRLKNLKKLSEFDDEAYWRAEEEQRNLKDEERSEMEEAFRKDEVIIQRRSLKKQMEEQKWLQKNNYCVEEIEEQQRNLVRDAQLRQLDLRDEESSRRKALLFEALAQQIVEQKAAASIRRQEEVMADKIMIDEDRKNRERELAAIRNQKMEEWKELVLFRQSMVEYRNSSQARDEDVERTAAECNKDIEEKKYELRGARERLKKDLAMECWSTSKRIASQRAARDNALKRRDLEERVIATHYSNVNDRLSSEYEKEKILKINPAPINEKCLKYSKTLQERQRLEDKEMMETRNRLKDVQQKKLMEVLQRPLQDLCEHQHPMYRILKSRTDH